tara:strand:- start:503 stop:748 length:246 start_codon:yes stop_codon:yes gene_type:complete
MVQVGSVINFLKKISMNLKVSHTPCPCCHFFSSQVVVHTQRDRKGVILRRRHCKDCDHRWYTIQYPEVVFTNSNPYKAIKA